MGIEYDLIILATPKDYNKVKFCITSAVKYLNPQPQNFFIIYPDQDDKIIINDTKVYCINEKKALDLDPHKCKGITRPTWIYQQFLSLFQNVSVYDNYLIVDSDLIFNRQFNLFDNEMRQLFLGINQYHKPYFRLLKEIFDLERQIDHSFISEIMMFDKKICAEIVNCVNGIDEFYQLCSQRINKNFLLSEYELYGNYVTKFYPKLYLHKYIKSNLNGKFNIWTDQEIRKIIKDNKDKDYDVITYHTWEK